MSLSDHSSSATSSTEVILDFAFLDFLDFLDFEVVLVSATEAREAEDGGRTGPELAAELGRSDSSS